MIKNKLNINPESTIEFSLPDHYTIHRILIFLKLSLPVFEEKFRTVKQPIYLEDEISKQLSLFLQNEAKYQDLLFDFNPRKGVDFGIYISPLEFGTKPIFVIEAKRLSKSKYDYVKNPNGGIERFKCEQEGFGKHLSQSAIIGYLQEESFQYWENKINNWIQNLIIEPTDISWSIEDKLVKDENYANYISYHSRISQSPITLYHFWLNMN